MPVGIFARSLAKVQGMAFLSTPEAPIERLQVNEQKFRKPPCRGGRKVVSRMPKASPHCRPGLDSTQ